MFEKQTSTPSKPATKSTNVKNPVAILSFLSLAITKTPQNSVSKSNTDDLGLKNNLVYH